MPRSSRSHSLLPAHQKCTHLGHSSAVRCDACTSHHCCWHSISRAVKTTKPAPQVLSASHGRTLECHRGPPHAGTPAGTCTAGQLLLWHPANQHSDDPSLMSMPKSRMLQQSAHDRGLPHRNVHDTLLQRTEQTCHPLSTQSGCTAPYLAANARLKFAAAVRGSTSVSPCDSARAVPDRRNAPTAVLVSMRWHHARHRK
jgi:hypothetical protein